MHQVFGILLAQGQGFNVQQMLASGVIGGGAAMMIGAGAQLFQKPKPPAEGKPVPKKLHPLIAILLMVVGLALVVVGAIWRAASQQPAPQ